MVLSLKEIPAFVNDHIIPLCTNYSIFAFTGPLGSGKTTLIREILKQFGVKETITSPTFGYLKSYQTSTNVLVYHFDLYRINSIKDFIAAGFDEYLSQPNSIVLIEWPEVICQLLTSSNIKPMVVYVSLDYHSPDQKVRLVSVITHQS
jgi:tRNA threonylcarbamoyladenosine biosynthesis protein TsaE